MGVVSDLLDATVEIYTGSVDAVAAKWQPIVYGIVIILLVVIIAAALAYSPTVGVGLIALVLGSLYLLTDGDGLL